MNHHAISKTYFTALSIEDEQWPRQKQLLSMLIIPRDPATLAHPDPALPHLTVREKAVYRINLLRRRVLRELRNELADRLRVETDAALLYALPIDVLVALVLHAAPAALPLRAVPLLRVLKYKRHCPYKLLPRDWRWTPVCADAMLSLQRFLARELHERVSYIRSLPPDQLHALQFAVLARRIDRLADANAASTDDPAVGRDHVAALVLPESVPEALPAPVAPLQIRVALVCPADSDGDMDWAAVMRRNTA